jgi:uncharacterized protein (TIGR02246 family)
MRPFLALLVLAACAPKAETPEAAAARIQQESADAKRAIDSLNADFDRHFNQGHGEQVAAQYTDDGELQVVGSPLLKGRQAISAAVTGLGQMKAAIKTGATRVDASGDLAIERGEYTLSMTPPGAPAAVSETGVYLIHWHRVDGKWLRVSDVASTAAPAPMDPPK